MEKRERRKRRTGRRKGELFLPEGASLAFGEGDLMLEQLMMIVVFPSPNRKTELCELNGGVLGLETTVDSDEV